MVQGPPNTTGPTGSSPYVAPRWPIYLSGRFPPDPPSRLWPEYRPIRLHERSLRSEPLAANSLVQHHLPDEVLAQVHAPETGTLQDACHQRVRVNE